MELQPLSFTYTARNPADSLTTPTKVRIENMRDIDQLTGLHIQELRLLGGIDLSTSEQMIIFNGWLLMAKYSVTDGESFVKEPKGKYEVELIDECAVNITASLTCAHDFLDLSEAVINLVRHMHEPPR